ncbi:MAG TPA: lytic murein transglycosylase [Actinomycetes bacterium]|nr:lytic murein transglycosylase [Actinomycetes bacterium]
MRTTARFRRAGAVVFLSLCAAAAGVPGGGLRALMGSESLLGDPSAASAYPFNPWADPVHPPVPTPLPLPPVPPTTVPSQGATPGVPADPVYPPYLGGYQYGVPANVYAAYVRAAAAMRLRDLGCHLSWAMLAGVGRIESGHARGGDLYADGTSRTRIIGIALDGSRPGTATVPDSDNGAWDGDTRWDHAVGPMQFLPGTWRHFGQDGNSDGRRDPHNMHDAALAAATYLCAGGRDLATSSGLQAAIFAYNPSAAYVAAVIAWINVYRQAGVPVPAPQGPSTPPPTHTASPTAPNTQTHRPSHPPTTASPTPTPRTPKTRPPTASPTGTPPDTAAPTPTVDPTPTDGPTPTGTGCPTATPTDTTSPSGTPTDCPPVCPTGTPTPSAAATEAQPDPAPSCPAPSPAASPAPTAAPSDGSTGAPTSDPAGGTGQPAGSSRPAAEPAKKEKPVAREQEPASTPAVASSSESSGKHSPTPTAPPNPADATARITVGTIASGAVRVADPDLVGTITVTPVRDGWQVSVEHLRGFGGTVRHLDQLDARIKESIAAQYGTAAGRAVVLVAVLDEDAVTALRAVRRTADEPNSAAAREARIAFGRIAAAAGLSARDVDYLITVAQ